LFFISAVSERAAVKFDIDEWPPGEEARHSFSKMAHPLNDRFAEPSNTRLFQSRSIFAGAQYLASVLEQLALDATELNCVPEADRTREIAASGTSAEGMQTTPPCRKGRFWRNPAQIRTIFGVILPTSQPHLKANELN
jgi:hypothetical protein